ncbi:Putative zinc- or iron-chelating domain-containing protein [Desulfonema limicola]|uniref:Zinc- or iron-chelating domain-containing protein n=1 Tax=Desulfonema limicola TaxID=45656 RepID=A0A975B613_9BACT|nr:YkgJ family cysteine cluster protein [Desulfonema limicola]QTA79419.1 Putative zinc- or iron-chelating domain-containing protein [Desulfonema limicola]
MENEITAMALDDIFRFECSSKISCFNECCRDLSQFLTPYDIVRLKNNIGLSSDVFIEKYTTQHMGPETGLPIVVIRQDPANGFQCPFLSNEGCMVYQDRPGSCRTYPLARLAYRSRETGQINEQYVMLQEDHCKGRYQKKTQTVRQWIKEQGLDTYNQMNDLFMEIISLKNQFHPAPLDVKERHMFQLACYDLDNFRKQVFNNNLAETMDVDPACLEAAENDDVELMKLGFQWIKQAVFNEKQ